MEFYSVAVLVKMRMKVSSFMRDDATRCDPRVKYPPACSMTHLVVVSDGLVVKTRTEVVRVIIVRLS